MRWLAGFLVPFISYAATTAADLARGIHEIELDRAECYRVHDVQISKDDIHFYFTDGYMIFAKPVGGTPTAAVFSADVEAGDAEMLLIPPNRSERKSLAMTTGTPTLNEHFGAAVLLLGDESYADLIRQIHGNEFDRRTPEMGAMMAEEWTSVVRNISESFEARLLLDLLSPDRRHEGAFIAAVSGKKLGNFDVVYEPSSSEQIAVGQVKSRDDRPYFDIWTSFESAPFRKGSRKVLWPGFTVADYRIDATLETDLSLRAVTKVKVTPALADGRGLAFEISNRMKVTSASIDGQPAEVIAPRSLRAGLVRNDGNDMFLVASQTPFEAGRQYEVEIHHEGAVVADTGNQVYYVGPRGTWYPNAGMQFARYDLTFRYPKNLDLVTPGEIVSDTNDGMWRTTRRVTAAPIRFAGFNLGYYERVRIVRDGYTVEVCGNRAPEEASKPQPAEAQRPGTLRLNELATDVISALQFMTAHFGPPPLKTLEVSPIPGAFGQGFPGLLYLSTMSYLRRQDAAMSKLDPGKQNFFTDLLQVHETAHQWWGNIVTSAGYHDDWLMESLANYSALLYLEQRDGRQTLDAMLAGYKDDLLRQDVSGQTVESAGPIVLGTRLQNVRIASAWNHITYGKGSWILHMLRAQIGDERFMAMLAELRRRYEWKSLSTDEFRSLAAEFLPPGSKDAKLEGFFDQWVYGTGIPSLQLSYSTSGKPPAVTLNGTLTQSGVDSEFSVQAPIEIQTGPNKQITWVRTASSPVEFTVKLKEAPTKVAVEAEDILAVEK